MSRAIDETAACAQTDPARVDAMWRWMLQNPWNLNATTGGRVANDSPSARLVGEAGALLEFWCRNAALKARFVAAFGDPDQRGWAAAAAARWPTLDLRNPQSSLGLSPMWADVKAVWQLYLCGLDTGVRQRWLASYRVPGDLQPDATIGQAVRAYDETRFSEYNARTRAQRERAETAESKAAELEAQASARSCGAYVAEWNRLQAAERGASKRSNDLSHGRGMIGVIRGMAADCPGSLAGLKAPHPDAVALFAAQLPEWPAAWALVERATATAVGNEAAAQQQAVIESKAAAISAAGRPTGAYAAVAIGVLVVALIFFRGKD